MDNIGFGIITILYFVIGWCLMTYWWWYEGLCDEYEKAKNSAEGVERGMASIYLLCLIWFWPIKIIYELIKNAIRKF